MAPEAFDRCVKSGGKVRTVSGPNKKLGLGLNQYVHVCIKDGKMHRGHIKKKHGKKES